MRRASRVLRARPARFDLVGPRDVRILGLDPGSITTGFAIVDCSGPSTVFVSSGGIRAQGDVFADRLRQIFAGIAAIIVEYSPAEVAIERVFMHRNADSALKLGQARGAALCATFAHPVRVFEYAPRQIKQAVVGTGSADKAQVQLMVTRLLGLDAQPAADAADALAVALCHAHSRHASATLALAGRRAR